ncbi:CHASE2 domain-containing protein [Mycoplana rhizolycopersici]|uniref:Adenylate/guanylate cyclase domain-containing protein n=1 Tax=Mycoplana rhizolycopersici TaxID=2746702 RepID=A0ABX2QFM1_9HYPH|nr:adenylate/guanylate cyclase domain-containing protein [Rhizobium rhizolycopersici]NVP55714.1 adenylate/guanylate cyclase domain-containing protein [Rhizobium rhizolycopersici]
MSGSAPKHDITGVNGTRRIGRTLRLVLLTVMTIAVVSTLTRFPFWSLQELRSFDYLSTFDDPSPPADSPVVVAIDEPSLAEINVQWPWPRDIHARLVEALRAAGARAIGLDIIFAEPSVPERDAALAAALGPDVVLAGDESLIVTPQAEQLVRTTPLPAFSDAGAVTGLASISLGGDGTFRDLPRYEDGFARELARIAGRPHELPHGDWLVQSFGPARSYPTVSYYQALDPDNFLPKDFFRDRVVIVGLSLQNAPEINHGGADAFATSYTVHTGRLVAGVEIQATIFDNIVGARAILKAGTPIALAGIALAAVLSALTVWRSTRWQTAAVTLGAVVALAAASFLLIRYAQLFVSPLGPALAFVSVAIGQAAFDYADERRNRKQITRAFSQYLSPALVERLARDPSQLRLGGERRTLSILFCDVRGFTTIAETMKDDPEQLTTLINRLLTPLSDIVLGHGGTIDKYIGDCLMAFWNAPLDDDDHANHAVAAAIDMLARMDSLNEELKREATERGAVHHQLRIGIGINTGECVVGNMGSSQRFDYSVLGDAVNLASRLEGASKNYGVPLLIGEGTALLADRFCALELDRITVKGRTTASPVFTALADVADDVAEKHRRLVTARYAGTLTPDDPLFDEMLAALPALSPYYRIVRNERAENAG